MIGFSTTICPEEGYRRCPEFWDREYTQKYARLWRTGTPETAGENAICENGIGVPVCRLPQSRESGTETAPAATPISREH